MEKESINNQGFEEQRILAAKLLDAVSLKNNPVKTLSGLDSYINLKEKFDKTVSDKEEFVRRLREKGDDFTADFIEKVFSI